MRRYYHGRGAFESMGAGLDMAEGDIAFKCNFATYDPATGIVVRRRADRRFETLGPVLCAQLDGEYIIYCLPYWCALCTYEAALLACCLQACVSMQSDGVPVTAGSVVLEDFIHCHWCISWQDVTWITPISRCIRCLCCAAY